MTELREKLDIILRGHPGRELLSGAPGSPWITAAALGERVEELGRRLDELGMKPDRAVMLRCGNNVEFVAASFAIWRKGGAVLPVDPDLPAAEIARVRKAFSPALVVESSSGDLAARPSEDSGEPGRFPGIAMIRLTSGSTGAPRGALIPPKALLADGEAICSMMGIGPDDINIGVVPLSHSYGFDNLLMPLVVRGSHLLLLESPLPGLILKALGSTRPLNLPLVPYLVDLLARHQGSPLPAGSGLKLVLSAGAPLPSRTASRFRSRFGLAVHTFYGASEAGGITFDNGEGPDGCVGTGLPGVRIGIDRSGLPDLPPGDGRVIVSGPAVGAGYHPDPSSDYEGGVFRTQDLGHLDDEGRLHLTGRVSSLVNISGRKVNPMEVERALLSLEEIRDAAVLGFSDPLRGERIEAWVVPAREQESSAIRKALADRLSAHKIPRVIHLVSEIPRTARGKLDRLKLKQA